MAATSTIGLMNKSGLINKYPEPKDGEERPLGARVMQPEVRSRVLFKEDSSKKEPVLVTNKPDMKDWHKCTKCDLYTKNKGLCKMCLKKEKPEWTKIKCPHCGETIEVI